MAVLYGSIAGISVGKQLMAGLIPGLAVAACLMCLNSYQAKKHGYGQAVLYRALSWKERIKIFIDAIPPFMMPVVILGGILAGIFTPTEAAVVSVIYAFTLAVFGYRELNSRCLVRVCINSVSTSAGILLIIGAAAPFAWGLTIKNITTQIANTLIGISDVPFILITILMVMILILGTFMESFSLEIILTPILIPVAAFLGFDPYHWGVIIIYSITIGAVTPPLAVCLFTACSIANIKVEETFPDILYVLGVMCIALIVIILMPWLSTWIPSMM
jgi:C4-dicarboxylate transporter DctM subunit